MLTINRYTIRKQIDGTLQPDPLEGVDPSERARLRSKALLDLGEDQAMEGEDAVPIGGGLPVPPVDDKKYGQTPGLMDPLAKGGRNSLLGGR